MSSTSHSEPQRRIEDDEIDLRELFSAIWFYKWPILLTTILFGLGGVIYALTATPVYQADAMLEVSGNKNQVLGELSDLLADNRTPADTEIELIKSRLVLGQTIKQLGLNIQVSPKNTLLDRVIPSSSGAGRVEIGEFTLQDAWLNRSFTLIAQGPHEYTVITPEGSRYSGRIGQPLNVNNAFTLLIKKIEADLGQEFSLIHYSDLNAIEKLKSTLSVAPKGKNVPIIGLTMTGTQPTQIVNTLNGIIDNYLVQNRDKDIQAARYGLKFIEEELPRLHTELQDAEDKLNQYRTQNKSLDVPSEARGTLEGLNKLEMQIVDLKTEESVLSEVYTPDHPAYKALKEKIQVLENAKKRLNKQITEMPATQQEIVRLTRNVTISQNIYTQLLNKQQELSILQASSQGSVRVIDRAAAAEHPIKPKKAIIVALATMVGLFLSVLAAVVKALFKQGISSHEDIEVLGIDVVANVPRSTLQNQADAAFKKLKKKSKDARSNSLITLKDPTDPSVEALRALRTNLYFSTMDKSNKTIMISGATEGVGKTFVAANLAVLMAQTNNNVLIIDGDMRKGYAHSIFEMENETGFTDLMTEAHTNYKKFIYPTKTNNLSFIPRGSGSNDAAELLQSPRLQEFLVWAQKQYDYIIIDTPPILAVTDAAIIGQHIGTSLLVCYFGKTEISDMEETLSRFRHNKVDIHGVVLNGIERTAKNAYKYQYGKKYVTE
ncbi:polysaccharide biosynthesis tyrosine autokinase [Conchiformibius steedae]|uniref:Putative tyrosine-protein kinase EpsB n=1 Tax=Conchiformibius steedae TaxID=153493 RepID=A0A3P2A6W7_9NEIS|nr:polysaccharide biosynthesis tyrosine autokinase [Conchiformibius steedae]RRD91134.1 polysaccharide biosynthesis tyrosine autokinase [Conchiformibius steedae]